MVALSVLPFSKPITVIKIKYNLPAVFKFMIMGVGSESEIEITIWASEVIK